MGAEAEKLGVVRPHLCVLWQNRNGLLVELERGLDVVPALMLPQRRKRRGRWEEGKEVGEELR